LLVALSTSQPLPEALGLLQAKSSEGDAVVVRSLREQLKAQEAQVVEARRLKEQAM